jgi:hypothetical protein
MLAALGLLAAFCRPQPDLILRSLSASRYHQLTATTFRAMRLLIRLSGKRGSAQLTPDLQAAGVLGQVNRQLIRPTGKSLMTVEAVSAIVLSRYYCIIRGTRGRTSCGFWKKEKRMRQDDLL